MKLGTAKKRMNNCTFKKHSLSGKDFCIYMNKGRPPNIIFIGVQNVNTEKFNDERSLFSIHCLMTC